jgi:hypothetical protein
MFFSQFRLLPFTIISEDAGSCSVEILLYFIHLHSFLGAVSCRCVGVVTFVTFPRAFSGPCVLYAVFDILTCNLVSEYKVLLFECILRVA